MVEQDHSESLLFCDVLELKVYVSKLRPWEMCWANHQTLDGLAGRDVIDAHHRICHAAKLYHDNAVFAS